MPEPVRLIDPENGFVRLPDGKLISSALTLDTFQADGVFAQDRTCSNGAPWWGYRFPGGRIDGKELLAAVQFYDQLLLSVDLTVNHYAPDQKTVSEKVEAAAKDFHDRLLERSLGRHSKTVLSPSSFPDRHPTLDRSLEWAFPWGTVSSIFVGQSCSSLMMVRYGKRWEEAHALDRRRRSSQPDQ
jgi:hypothetical protein